MNRKNKRKCSDFCISKERGKEQISGYVYLINFMYMIVMMSSFGVGQYYFQYVYGNLGTFSIVMAASVALFPVFAAIPKLSKDGLNKID